MRGWPLIKLLPQKTNLHFVKYARGAGILSVILCVASIAACFAPGLNMGIDFRGGASMEVSKPAGQTIQLDNVREAVNGLNLGDVQVQAVQHGLPRPVGLGQPAQGQDRRAQFFFSAARLAAASASRFASTS